MLSQKRDVYEQITAALIEAIEQGVGRYEMPWHSLCIPVNALNHKPYRGINVMMLWAAARKRAYSSNAWATYRQWNEIGSQVRKGGERSTVVVFWKFLQNSSECEIPGPEDLDPRATRPVCMARAYHVFNAAQVDGYTPRTANTLSESERIAQAEFFFSRLPAVVTHGGDQAFYSVQHDFIQLPRFEQFRSASAYYSVRAHESVHWTSTPSRCNRDLSSRFGDTQYAFEELMHLS